VCAYHEVVWGIPGKKQWGSAPHRLNKGDAVMVKEVKKAQPKPSLEMFQDEIRKIAEGIYIKRTASNKPGDALSDWLQAEKEVKKKYKL
jgi:hypothetical protein